MEKEKLLKKLRKTTATEYANAVGFKGNNKEIKIIKTSEDGENYYTIETKRLIVLKKESHRKMYIAQDSARTLFTHRPHSKYAIWFNSITYSESAMHMISGAYLHTLKDLDVSSKEEEE